MAGAPVLTPAVPDATGRRARHPVTCLPTRRLHLHHRGPIGARALRRRLARDPDRAGLHHRSRCSGGRHPVGRAARRRPDAAVGRADRRSWFAGDRASRPGGLPYRGPSPFLVFAAAIPVSLLVGVIVSDPARHRRRAARRSVRRAPVGHDPGARLRRAGAPARRRHRRPRLARDGRRTAQRTALLDMGGGALWAIPVIGVTAIVSRRPAAPLPGHARQPAAPDRRRSVGFALSLLAGVIVAPFGEEILFRGFATTAWVRGLGYRRGLLTAAPGLRLRPRPDGQRGRRPSEAFGLAVVGFSAAHPGRHRARLDLPPARDGLGVVRPPRRVQRHPPGPRREVGEPATLSAGMSRGAPAVEPPVRASSLGSASSSRSGWRGELAGSRRSGPGAFGRRRGTPMRALDGSAARSRTLGALALCSPSAFASTPHGADPRSGAR